MVEFFDQILDILIVHINKLVLLALFLVAVSRPTVLNALIFVMFLILSMVDHNSEYQLFKLTTFVNTFAIGTIYTFDVFIQRDFSTIRTWVLYIIGVQYRKENIMSDFVKLKYLPYVFLQIFLVLCAYILKSEKYLYFKSSYMDIETQKQMELAHEVEQQNKANSVNHPLSGKAKSRSSGSRAGSGSQMAKSVKEGGTSEAGRTI